MIEDIKKLKTDDTVLMAFRYKSKILLDFLQRGINIRNDSILAEEMEWTRLHLSGWIKGIKSMGFKVIYITRPSIIVPEWLRKILPLFCVFALRAVTYIGFFRFIDDFFYGLYILYLVYKHKVKCLFYFDRWKWLCKRLKKKTLVIEYNDILLRQGEKRWLLTERCEPDVILSCYDVTKLKPDISNRAEFLRLDLGIDAERFVNIDFSSTSRTIDVIFIGIFNDISFKTRSLIVEELLRQNFDLNIKIFGTFSFSKPKEYHEIIKRIGAPLYGRNYYKKLMESKLAIVIPSDSHIEAGEGMPARLFDNAACGCCQLVYDCKAVYQLFIPDEEIVIFDNPDNLLEKIKDLVRDNRKRERIARKGYEKFVREYSAQNQIIKIFSRLI